MPRTKERNLRLIKRREKGTLNKKGFEKGGTKETLSHSRQRRV
jgi:hypothetical protein